MGEVYEALQHGARGFVKRVAIKVIRGKLASQPDFIANFIGEARLVADLIHTNIVQTYHLGESDGTCFICMELIRGVNLEQFLNRLQASGRRLPIELAVFIVSRIARGLAYAHAKRDRDGRLLDIVHRDINPKNILIAFEGDVKLTDFGVAKARGFLKDKEGEEVAGKPEYMSPEQADFLITDRRSDLFSVGIVLSQLLTGSNVFRGQSPEDSRNRVLKMPIPDFCRLVPEIEPRLDQILQKALQRELSARYQSADELLYDLEFYIYHRGYGPTNETLGKFIRDLFQEDTFGVDDPTRGGTAHLDKARSGNSRASSLFERIKSQAP
ncbi:MAG: serine/threonine protein kinase [Verrucomicrobiales bacterium]|nr:serine/threonine protein kinase [Verrucomicrobiales bacterium]